MFSVVIPLYNKAPYVARALDAALAQNESADEIIVVDDGSTDGGTDIVDKYIAQGVRLFRQENQGVSVARNKGVELSSSEYIAFLDADDWWKPNHLQSLRTVVESCPSAALFSTATLLLRDGATWREPSSFKEGSTAIIPEFLRHYAKERGVIHSPSAAVRRRVFLEVGGFPVGVAQGEDIITWVKMALRCPVAHVETATCIVDKGASSASTAATEIPGALKYLAGLLVSKDLSPTLRQDVGQLFDGIGCATAGGAILNGQRHLAVQIRSLAWRRKRWGAVCTITGLLFTPARILYYLQNYRKTPVQAS